MVPLLFVLRSDDESWKSVVEPVLEMEKRVVVAVRDEEPIAKSVVLVELPAAEIESVANGEDVPNPTLPKTCIPPW